MRNQPLHRSLRRTAALAASVLTLLGTSVSALAQSITAPLTVTTIAGLAGARQPTDGTGSSARFYSPAGMAIDSSGNLIVADTSNNLIRKVTAAGVVTTPAGRAIDPVVYPINIGTSDGTGTSASFHMGEFTSSGSTWDTPVSTIVGANTVAIDSSGTVFLTDTLSDTIRKVTSGGTVTTIAGSANTQGSADATGASARFFVPAGLGMDSSGNLYIADSANDTIRKMTPAGVVTTFAGSARAFGSADGTGTAARFTNPAGVAVDASGNIYVTDSGNNTIRKITSGGVVTTLAGSAGHAGATDGSGTQARFNGPTGITVAGNGNIYVADTGNNTIRMVTPAGLVSTVAGSAGVSGSTDGTGSTALFNQPYGVVVNQAGSVLYIADTGNNTIRQAVRATTSATLQVTGVPPAKIQTTTNSNVTLKVVATGSPTPTYQWYKDGAAISGATSATLQLNGVTSANVGNYFVVVKADILTFSSSVIALSVYAQGTPVPVTIVTQPSDRSITLGQNTTFTVEAVSPTSASLTYQWSKDGAAISGATNSTYTVNSATANSAGVYTATVSDGANTAATTSGATLTITNSTTVAPSFTTQPASQSVIVGNNVTLTAAANGTPTPTYQWQKNGAPVSNGGTISGATTATLTISGATTNDAGSYTVIATNSAGSVVSNTATITVSAAPTGPTAWLTNLSVRTTMTAGQDPLIVGLTTNDSKSILVRGIGPGLANYGVSGVLADPKLQLYPLGSSTATLTNDDWDASLAGTFASVGAFSLTSGSKDAAFVQTIKGGYSVWELATGSGIVLVEAYDADPNNPAKRLTNLSARNFVGTGDNVLIAGFAVQGSGKKNLLVRAIGPTLASYGVAGTLTDPRLDVYSGSTVIASNDNWDASLAATFKSVGAFDLVSGSKDAATVISVDASTPAKIYTVQVSGVGGGTGAALVEIYELP